VFGLELVEYTDCYEAILHVLESNDWTERGQTYSVQDVEVLEQKIPWVVVGNNTSTYHFPDPTAAAYGEPAPACGAGSDDSSYRITRITTVYPGYGAYKSCVRHAKPVELAGVHCAKCEKGICHGTLPGRAGRHRWPLDHVPAVWLRRRRGCRAHALSVSEPLG